MGEKLLNRVGEFKLTFKFLLFAVAMTGFGQGAFAENLLSSASNFATSSWYNPSSLSVSGNRINFPNNNSSYCISQLIKGKFSSGNTYRFLTDSVFKTFKNKDGSNRVAEYPLGSSMGIKLKVRAINARISRENEIKLTQNETQLRAYICRQGSKKLTGNVQFSNLRVVKVSDKTYHDVSSVSGFQQAIDIVPSGGYVRLKNGTYSQIKVKYKYFSKDVTIRPYGSHQPQIKKMDLIHGENIVVTKLKFRPRFTSGANGKECVVLRGNNITFDNNDLNYADSTAGWSRSQWIARTGFGVYIAVDNLTFTNNLIRNVDFGLRGKAKNSLIENNVIDGFRGDAMTYSGSEDDAGNTTVQYNIIKNTYYMDDGNHNDGIQFYARVTNPYTLVETTNTGTLSGFTVRRNFILQTDNPSRTLENDYMQGIVGFKGDGFYDMDIEDNLIITNTWHGIMLDPVGTGVIIRNNTVLDIKGVGSQQPWVGAVPLSSLTTSNGPIVRYNISHRKPSAAFGGSSSKVRRSSNVEITADKYSTHFYDYDNEDARLKRSSPYYGGSYGVR